LPLTAPLISQGVEKVQSVKHLLTERLLLRSWSEQDHPKFAEINADPKVMRYFPNTLDQAQSNQLAEEISRRLNQQAWGFWAVELRASAQFIGFVGLNEPDYPLPCSPCIEIAWRLSQSHWNRGYATEAAFAALDFGFSHLRLEEIVSFTACSNLPSQAVMKKLGMSLRKSSFLHPKLDPAHPLAEHVLYTITKSDYLLRQDSK